MSSPWDAIPVTAADRARTRRFMWQAFIAGTVVAVCGAFYVAVLVTADAPKARMRQAQIDVRSLASCIDAFRVREGRYPTDAEGLKAVVKLGADGFCNPSALRDPWGRPYLYEAPGPAHPDGFVVESLGADGSPGGDGENADIRPSW